MPAFNFKEQFAGLVESGKKRQTIRRTLKPGSELGATAYLYTGQRTAQCRKLGEGTIIDIRKIEIGRNGCGEPYAFDEYSGKTMHLVHKDLDMFAADDGFRNGEDMAAWFHEQYGLPFNGYLYRWRMRAAGP